MTDAHIRASGVPFAARHSKHASDVPLAPQPTQQDSFHTLIDQSASVIFGNPATAQDLNQFGETPLLAAAAKGQSDTVAQLVKSLGAAGACASTQSGWYAEHYAALQDDSKTLQCLAAGAAPAKTGSELRDKRGITPQALREAAQGVNRRVVTGRRIVWSQQIATTVFENLDDLQSQLLEDAYRKWKDGGRRPEHARTQISFPEGEVTCNFLPNQDWFLERPGRPRVVLRRDLAVDETVDELLQQRSKHHQQALRIHSEGSNGAGECNTCVHDAPPAQTPVARKVEVGFVSTRAFSTGHSSFILKGQLGEAAVAVKLPTQSARGHLAAFERSVECLAAVQGHPNVMPLLGVHMDGAIACPVIPFSEYGPLSALIFAVDIAGDADSADGDDEDDSEEGSGSGSGSTEAGARPYDVLDVANQIAAAMAFIAARRINHRNLTTEHVIVFVQGDQLVCKVGGFSCATTEEHQEPLRNDLSPSHMAPELIDDPKCASEQSDVYSFGIVMWELAHRAEPYTECCTDFQILQQARKQCRPEISPAVRHEFATLPALIEAAWQHEPHQRPSFSQLVFALSCDNYPLPFDTTPSALAMTADDRSVVVGTDNGEVHVLTGNRLEEHLQLDAVDGGAVLAIAASSDATRVAAMSASQIVVHCRQRTSSAALLSTCSSHDSLPVAISESDIAGVQLPHVFSDSAASSTTLPTPATLTTTPSSSSSFAMPKQRLARRKFAAPAGSQFTGVAFDRTSRYLVATLRVDASAAPAPASTTTSTTTRGVLVYDCATGKECPLAHGFADADPAGFAACARYQVDHAVRTAGSFFALRDVAGAPFALYLEPPQKKKTSDAAKSAASSPRKAGHGGRAGGSSVSGGSVSSSGSSRCVAVAPVQLPLPDGNELLLHSVCPLKARVESCSISFDHTETGDTVLALTSPKPMRLFALGKSSAATVVDGQLAILTLPSSCTAPASKEEPEQEQEPSDEAAEEPLSAAPEAPSPAPAPIRV